VDSARLLLDAGADVNAVEQDQITPLLMAISNNRIPTDAYGGNSSMSGLERIFTLRTLRLKPLIKSSS
jgi:ankyrin repeat protein